MSGAALNTFSAEVPKNLPWWLQLAACAGFSLEERSPLLGVAKRLSYLLVGLLVVAGLGAIAPAWLALAVLAIGMLPFVFFAAVRDLALMAQLILVGVLLKVSCLTLYGRFLWHQVETAGVILAAAHAAAWLLA